MKPNKASKHRVRMTVASQNVEYPDNVSTPTVKSTTTKVLINSSLSTKDARFTTLDIKNIYLQTLLNLFEYMKIWYDLIPDEIKEQYNLQALNHNGWIYV